MADNDYAGSNEDNSLTSEELEALLSNLGSDTSAEPMAEPTDESESADTLSPDELERLLGNFEQNTSEPVPAVSDEEIISGEAELELLLNSLDTLKEDEIEVSLEDMDEALPDEKLTEFQDMFSKMDSIPFMPDNGPDESIDDKIQKALAIDEEESYQFEEIEDLPMVEKPKEPEDMPQEDPSAEIEAPVDGPNKKKRIAKPISFKFDPAMLKSKKFLICAGAASVAVVFAAAFLISYFTLSKANGGAVLELPNADIDNSGMAFVGEAARVDGGLIVIEKIQLTKTATNLFISGFLNIEDYNINIIDEKDNVYFMALSSLQPESAAPETEAAKRTNKTVLSFEPLREGIKKITLQIANPATGEITAFHYALDETLSLAPAKYIAAPVLPSSTNHLIDMRIESGVFSSSDSTLNFKLPSRENGGEIVFGAADSPRNVQLKDSARAAKLKNAAYYSFGGGDGSEYAQYKFTNVSSIGRRVTVVCDNLYEKFDAGVQIRAQRLSGQEDERSRSLTYGKYKVCLERMYKDGYARILEFRAENTEIEPEDGEPSAENLVEAYIDAKLVIKYGDTETAFIDGTVKITESGSIVVFDTSGYEDEAALAGDDNLWLQIDSVRFKSPAVIFDVNLARAPTSQMPALQRKIDFLTNAFKSRLEYKSGNIKKEEIEGFSQDILSDSSFAEYYAPVEDKDAKPAYSVQIMFARDNGESLDAIVGEIWRQSPLSPDSLIISHKVSVTNDGESNIISKDEITETR